MRDSNLSKTITSVLGRQQHELIDIAQRKLLTIFGEVGGTSFVIIPGWYVGNEKYEDDKLTAVDVELVEKLEQLHIEQTVCQLLEERGQKNFRVSFWGASGFPQDLEFSENSPEFAGKSAKILVVDDDPGIREIIKLHLERQGYSVQTASSTSQAAKLMSSNAEPLPNLMLLDIMMPGATGWQLLKDLENDPRVNKIPVIAISGLEKQSLGEQYDSKMLYDYLVKPFSMEELSRVVRKFSRA
jgi:CheY-like chemotaxis protein